MSIDRSGNRWIGLMAAIAFVAGVAVSSPVAASTVESGGGAAADGLVLDSRQLIPPANDPSKSTTYGGTTLATLPEMRRGFLLADGVRVGQVQGFKSVRAVDLDTSAEVGRADLPLPGYLDVAVEKNGQPHTMTVDADRRRLFVAHQQVGNEALGALVGPGTVGRTSSALPYQQTCLNIDQVTPVHCFHGVHVIDAEKMEVTRSIPYQPIRAEGGTVGPRLLAMTYSKPVSSEQAPKLLLVVEEFVTNDEALSHTYRPRVVLNNSSVYAVQLDPETGRQDWAVRIDACKSREPRSEGGLAAMRLPHAATVLRSRTFGDDALIVGCHAGSTQSGAVVKVPLDAAGNPYSLPVATEPTAVDQERRDPAGIVVLSPPSQVFGGPDRTMEILADAPSGRILMRVVDGPAEVWWVFDSAAWQLAGTVGIGKTDDVRNSHAVLDDRSGRLYVIARAVEGFNGGLLLADIRRTPLPQALIFPDLVNVAPNPFGYMALSLEQATEGRPTRLFVRSSGSTDATTPWRIIEDHLPVTVDPPVIDYEGRTLDLEETEGVTSTVFDGAARGYGARVLLVGGADAVARVGPADPIGQAYSFQETGVFQLKDNDKTLDTSRTREGLLPASSPCSEVNRDVVFGFVGPQDPAIVDASGTRASAEPVVVDSSLSAELESPVSRCSPVDWEAAWSAALFGQAPADEPRAAATLGRGNASCVAPGQQLEQRFGDPVLQGFSASAACTQNEAAGWAQARAVTAEGATVAAASSSFRIYRDPGRGIVARVESVTRGLALDGVLRIDTVRGVAESWANGRRQVVPEAARDERYDPNCDFERTAGSCFVRHVFGVWTPGYQCGPCGDEIRLMDGLNRAFNGNAVIGFRDPYPPLARGSENGFIAGVSKRDSERFADLVLNNDLLQTVLPTLEIIRFAPPNRFFGGGTRGRQIYQFAGVEVSTSYGIACLLVYDEATNSCAAEKELPGSIQVSLSDPDGRPLAGGAFEVRQDVDADGLLGLKDTLLPEGACVTADDGVGTCTFENLQPGSYLVSQVAAPPGYAKSSEPWVSEVASGERRTVAFTNVSNVSTIDLTATDENGAPISGAVFAAYADPDGDGKMAQDSRPAAECTTDARGACSMRVPAGSYVLVQTAAPGGLSVMEPVPFTFASGGQVAAVTVVNHPPDVTEPPAAPASPVYTPPVDVAPPVEVADYYTPAVSEPEVAPGASLGEQVGGTVTQVIRAPGDALRLLARDPKQAVAWTAALVLFALAVMAVRRRQQAISLMSD